VLFDTFDYVTANPRAEGQRTGASVCRFARVWRIAFGQGSLEVSVGGHGAEARALLGRAGEPAAGPLNFLFFRPKALIFPDLKPAIPASENRRDTAKGMVSSLPGGKWTGSVSSIC
jgi:hypothetical protein